MNKRQIGYACEGYACKYLQDLGYEILKRNYFSKFGEIDIIARKEAVLVFVEVKARLDKSFGPPSEALTPGKIQNIRKTASSFLLEDTLNEKRFFAYDKRIDFIGISYEGRRPQVNHIENVTG